MTTKIDRENAIIKDVVIANYGWDKTGDYMDDVFLKSLADHGNAQTNGVKSRFGHPTMCKEGLGTYIGRFKNFRYELKAEKSMGDPEGQKYHTIADLHLDKTAKKSPGGDLYTYVLDMAEKNNDMFGNSIAFFPDESQKIKINTDGGEKEVDALRLKSFVASDLVDSPAATENLFKDIEGNYAAKATEFLEENPEIFEIISEHPEILKEFLLKFHTYKNQKTMADKKKSLYEKFKAKVNALIDGDVKSISATGDDGSEISIITDNEAPAEGDEAQNSEGKPASDGNYTQGSNVVSVAGGKVTSVKPKEEDSEDETEDEEKIAKEFADLTIKNKKLEKELGEQKSDLEEVKKELEKIKKSISTDYEPKKKKSFVPPDKKKDKDEDEEKPKTIAERAAATAR
ncbi:MAG TPA: hypothetical protein VJY62_02440 [Bacteroidia bacterium]|nr:hypothetical protein [Bacteroidia bacterium]